MPISLYGATDVFDDLIETARRRTIGALEAIRLTLAGASLVPST
jgi:hypothetical protein